MKETTIRRWLQAFGGWKIWQVLALMVLIIMVLVATTVALAGARDRGTVHRVDKPFGLLRGQVINLATESCLIKDATGKSISITMNKRTKIIGIVKEGDTVEVYLSPEGVAISIFK